MTIDIRHYHHTRDYQRVDDFLIDNYLSGNADGNWIEPIWEYMHFHPALDSASLDRIGIWENEGKIVAVAHFESCLGEAFFQFHSGYHHLRQEMLAYAEQNLVVQQEDGHKKLSVYINDRDEDFLALVRNCGYQRDRSNDRPMARFDIPIPFPAIPLPEGFRLTSLAEDCDWAKVHRVMWRGFNHPGEPPAGQEELDSRQHMFDTPSARRDLKIAVTAPNGDFVSFCGMFYEPAHQVAYVEPVATDPDYRRMGLGKAAVLEGIRRCAELGAKTAYVGSDQLFYQAIGFNVFSTSMCWVKEY